MDRTNFDLTAAEWNLMECLWETAPRTGREAVEYLKAHVGWSRSTTLTMLRRMSEKGFIDCREEDGVKVYAPLIPREEAVVRETDHFLSRVYQGSISTFMNAFARKQKLTKDEIDALYDIIRTAEEASES